MPLQIDLGGFWAEILIMQCIPLETHQLLKSIRIFYNYFYSQLNQIFLEKLN